MSEDIFNIEEKKNPKKKDIQIINLSRRKMNW